MRECESDCTGEHCHCDCPRSPIDDALCSCYCHDLAQHHAHQDRGETVEEDCYVCQEAAPAKCAAHPDGQWIVGVGCLECYAREA